jgi:nickel transport protein
MVSRLLLLLLCLGLATSAQAHRLKLFVTQTGQALEGRVYFVGGTGASSAEVNITAADGRLLATLHTDDNGRFSYPFGRAAELHLTARTVDGHQANWSTPPALSGADSAKSPATVIHTTDQQLTETELLAQIDTRIARQLQPLQEQLNAHDERIRLQDILGGLGYILGLAGLALWWQAKKRDGTP